MSTSRVRTDLYTDSGAAFSKLPRKILGKLLTTTITTTTTQFSITSLNRIDRSISTCSTVALYPLDDVATCVSVAPKIRSLPKIFLGTFENVAPGPLQVNSVQSVFVDRLPPVQQYW